MEYFVENDYHRPKITSHESRVMRLPSKVYRYESFNIQSLRNLQSQAIYFVSPSQFNDPYDCALYAGIVEPDEDELERLRQHYTSNPAFPNPDQVRNLSSSDLRDWVVGLATEDLDNRRTAFMTNHGVCCFSERNDDLLMWSHYGGKHAGFCLEFCTSFQPFEKLLPVEYTDEMPSISLSSLILEPDSNPIRKLYCTKSLAWRYEKEWRGIHATAGTRFCYPAEALKAVYFGSNAEQSTIDIVCLILAGQNPGVELWRGSRSTERFAVAFERFTYTPYAVAKQGGTAQ